jgi:hypothetical protein
MKVDKEKDCCQAKAETELNQRQQHPYRTFGIQSA